MEASNKLPLFVSIKGDDVIIIVDGEGTMKISHVLKKFVMNLMDGSNEHKRVFKIDLRHCTYIDSTFTGLLVILEKYSRTKNNVKFEIVDPSEFCLNVLETMGILNMFDISYGNADYRELSVELESFHIEKTEKAILMYLAHKELSEVNKDNEKEFQDVQKYLKKHIEEETGKDIDDIDIDDLTFLDDNMSDDDDV